MGRKKKVNKEDNAEACCFRCKDGGVLRICDHKGCLKAYHPVCVEKNEDFIMSEVRWSCGWHYCFICKRASKFQCFCCPRAVCGLCLYEVEFVVVRETKGLCRHCLTLARLLEGVKDPDSDEIKIDFNDHDTYEYMFKYYWEDLKRKEGLGATHVETAIKLLKSGRNYDHGSCLDNAGGGLISSDSEDEDNFGSDDSDLNEPKCCKPNQRRKRIRRKMCRHGNYKPRQKEFVGWASKPLFDFLATIVKDTSKELSQHDVAAIITEYCKEKNLFHPEKKKKVVCDSLLQSFLRRKSVNRNKIYDLIGAHFAENLRTWEDEDDSECNLNDKTENLLMAHKRQRKASSKELVPEQWRSHFASVIAPNIKHVYLQRSLVEELLKKPETFSKKVIGSFVRVKSDPNDYMQRNSHQLLQVIGIKRTSGNAEVNARFFLQVSSSPHEIAICKLSDHHFSEDECEDLRRRVKEGLLQRPTVVELEEKAKTLHEDITKHWISKELARLQNLINQANEKGWRRELCEYMDRMNVLETPTEQSRLLLEVPEIIADNAEEPTRSDSYIMDKKGCDSALESNLMERTCRLHLMTDGSPQWLKNGTDFAECRGNFTKKPTFGNTRTYFTCEDHHTRGSSIGDVDKLVQEKEQQSEGFTSQWHQQSLSIAHESKDDNFIQAGDGKSNQEALEKPPESCLRWELPSEQHPITIPSGQPQDFMGPNEAVAPAIEFIELSDDEDPQASRKMSEGFHLPIWYTVSPSGLKGGPFSMSVLKKWGDTLRSDVKFKVWKSSQRQEEAIDLMDAIAKFFLEK